MIRALNIAIVLWLALCLALLCGCGGPSYRENAADIKAGIEAARQEPDAAARAAIYEAVAARIWALLSDIDDIPAPTMTPAEIRADVPAYVQGGAEVAADPPPLEKLTDREPKPTPGDIIRRIGEQVLEWSVWFALAGLVLMALRFVPWFGIGAIASFGPVPAIASLAAAGGFVSSVAGTAAVWLADYWWLVVICTIVAAGVTAVVYAKRGRIAELARAARAKLKAAKP